MKQEDCKNEAVQEALVEVRKHVMNSFPITVNCLNKILLLVISILLLMGDGGLNLLMRYPTTGSVKLNVLPLPSSLATHSRPPCVVMNSRAMLRPRPEPPR